MAGKKIVADLVEQALKIVMGESDNVTRLSDVKSARERDALIKQIKSTINLVKSGYFQAGRQDLINQKSLDLHKSGMLPLQQGTIVTPPSTWDMPGDWRVSGYWYDEKDPRRFGYKIQNESGQTYDAVASDPRAGLRHNNPYNFGGGFKAYAGPNAAPPKPIVSPVEKPAIAPRPPEVLDAINKEYEDLFGNEDLFKPKAHGGRTGYGPGGEIVEQALKLVMGGADEAAPISRLGMNYKDVTKRVPELTEAAKRVQAGEIGQPEYSALVDRFKPVEPYTSVPDPASTEAIINALTANKRDKVGRLGEYPEGHQVALRLDIPAYTNHGVWVPTIHDQKTFKTISHEPAAHISGAQFSIPENKALAVAAGGAKGPFATIDGSLLRTPPEDIHRRAQEAIENPEWAQVGMDPERHSYFYDRRTMQPVLSAEEVIQVGPLVLARKPVYGKPEDFKYSSGGRTGYGPGGVIDDIVEMAGKIVSGADEPAATGIRAYHGSPKKGLTRLSTRYAVETPNAVFAAKNPDVAHTFTIPREYGEPVYVDEFGNDIEPGEVFELNLTPKSVISVSPEEAQKFIDDTAFQTEFVKNARQKGHDLVVAPDVLEGIGERSRGDVYAVLDDRIISIIRKYGIAGASAMLGYNLMDGLDPAQAKAAVAADQEYQASGQKTGGMLPPGMEPSGELTSRISSASERLYDYVREHLLGDDETKGSRAETIMNVLDQTPATIPLVAYDLGRSVAEAAYAKGGEVTREGYQTKGRVVKEVADAAIDLAKRIFGEAPATETIKGADLLRKTEGLKEDQFGFSKFAKPLSEMEYTVEKIPGALEPYKSIDPHDLVKQNATIAGHISDRTAAGRKVINIGGGELTEPLLQRGGVDYQRATLHAWANRPGAAKSLNRKLNEAAGYKWDKSKKEFVPASDEAGNPLYTTPVFMGHSSANSSHMVGIPLIRMIPNMPISKADKLAFDAVMSERFPGWPGIDNTKEAEKFMYSGKIPGSAISNFIKYASAKKWKGAGFPDTSEIMFSAMDPRLVGVPQGSTGMGFKEFNPGRTPIIKGNDYHPDYPAAIPGKQYAGGFKYQVPQSLMLPDWWNSLKPELRLPENATKAQHTLMTQVPTQKATPEWADKIHEYWEENPMPWGYADGGEVYDDDDINDALRIAKDNGGSTGSVFMTDAKGINYDINGNIIPPEITGPNPARSETTPEQVGQRAAQDPATFDALMQKYAVPDQDIARYEATKAAVAKQPYETQQMTHVGAPPMRDVKVDMPLFGGEQKITQAPYNVASGLSGMAQTAYDFKTAPLYLTPWTAPIGAGLDVGEGVATGDPLQASLAALGAPGKYAKAAIIGGSNYLMSPAEAQAGPARWFSKAMEVANAIPMNKMTGEQALAMLRKGTSPEELKWTGTDVFLQGKPQVTKQELVDYLNKNRVQTQDVVLGGGNKLFRREDVRADSDIVAKYAPDRDKAYAEYTDLHRKTKEAADAGDWVRVEGYKLLANNKYREYIDLVEKMIDDQIERMGGLARSPKYADYSTPGGEGYQETLVTLSNKGMPKVVQQGDSWTLRDADNNFVLDNQGRPYFFYNKSDADKTAKVFYRESGKYKSSHWDDPDVLLHSRSQILDVTPPGANRSYKAWNVDETQSDWGQDARRKGVFDAKAHAEWDAAYRENGKKISEVQNQLKKLNTERSAALGPEPKSYGTEFNEYHTRRQSLLDNDPDIAVKRKELVDLLAEDERLLAIEPKRGQGSVAAAPYIGSTEGWTDLAIKKQLDMALDNGSDYFTWTPGDVQAERYGLDKQISGLKYDPLTKVLDYLPKDYVDDDFDWLTFGSGIEPEKLEDYVGKEVAEKLLASPGDKSGVKSLSRLDLKVGGEGMRGYYDKVYLKRLQEVVKKATGEKPNIEVIEVHARHGPRKQLGIRLTDEMREKARFSDFNKGGRVTGGNTYDNDSSVAHALALTSEY
jgi:hypothetical protein